MNKPNFDIVYTKWRLVDGLFCCIYCNVGMSSPLVSLSDYLDLFRFDIPEEITYCLARNEDFSLKYRVYCSTVHVYIQRLN